jgi:hypothetical protein
MFELSNIYHPQLDAERYDAYIISITLCYTLLLGSITIQCQSQSTANRLNRAGDRIGGTSLFRKAPRKYHFYKYAISSLILLSAISR